MKTAQQRLNNIIGQLEGAKKMTDGKRSDCFALLIQLKAARSAVSALMEKVIGEELEQCLMKSKTYDREKVAKIFKEVLKK